MLIIFQILFFFLVTVLEILNLSGMQQFVTVERKKIGPASTRRGSDENESQTWRLTELGASMWCNLDYENF